MLLQFKNIELEDKEIIESYTKPWNIGCSDLSFANLFWVIRVHLVCCVFLVVLHNSGNFCKFTAIFHKNYGNSLKLIQKTKKTIFIHYKSYRTNSYMYTVFKLCI